MEFNDSLLRSWLNYIHLEDKAAAAVAPKFSEIIEKLNGCIQLNGNNLLIKDAELFNEVKEYVKKRKENSQEQISLSFPYIRVRTRDEDKLNPLFVIDLEDVFSGEYLEEGWDLTTFETSPSSLNIQEALRLDDEELENVFIGDRLVFSLNEIFSLEANDSEAACMQLADKCKTDYFKGKGAVESKPYVFEYKGEGFNRGLRNDYAYIINQQKKELKIGNSLLTAYVSNKQAEPSELFFGALGKFPPTSSQAKVVYKSVSNKIVAAKGPPGTGKTTLILNIVAQQVVSAALSLINGKDKNYLTVISSTNNRAVENAVEQLVELTGGKVKGEICLQGGKKDLIRNQTTRAIKEKIRLLQNEEFDDAQFASLQNEIRENKENINKLVSEFTGLVNKVKKYKNLINKTNGELLELKEQENKIETELIRILEEAVVDTRLKEDTLEQIDWINYHRISDLLVRYVQTFPRVFDWFNFRSKKHIIRLNEEMKELISFTWGYLPAFRLSAVSSEDELLALQEKVADLIKTGDINGNLKNVKEQSKALAVKLEKLMKTKKETKESARVWLEDIYKDKKRAAELVSNLAFEKEDIFSFYHELFFRENMELFYLSLDYLWQYILQNKDIYIDTLEKYQKLLNGNSMGLYAEISSEAQGFFLNLSRVFPVFSTTLQSVRNMFMYTLPNLIDKVIIDEAGMVKNFQAVPLLFRANSAVIVGDPLQIPPVITHGRKVLEEYEQKVFAALTM